MRARGTAASVALLGLLTAFALSRPAAAAAPRSLPTGTVIADLTLSLPRHAPGSHVDAVVGGPTAEFLGWRLLDTTAAAVPTDCADVIPGFKPSSVDLGSYDQGGHQVTLVAEDLTGVCHAPTTATVSLDSVTPWVVGLKASYTGTTTPGFRLTWGVADGPASSGLQGFTGSVVDDETTQAVSISGSTESTSLGSDFIVAGHSYTASVAAHDLAGNASQVATLGFVAPLDEQAFSLNGFVRSADPVDYMGSHAHANTAGSWAKATFHGSKAYVGVIKSPTSGFVDIYVDDVKRARADLYATTVKHHQLLPVPIDAMGDHTVVLRAVGNHRPGAKGNTVDTDSLYVGSPAAPDPRALFFGDSLFTGGGTDPLQPVEVQTASRALHWQAAIDAIPGSGYTTGGGNGQPYLGRMETDGFLSRHWDVVVLEGGTNDADHGSVPALLQAARQAVDYVQQQQPWARVVLVGAFAPEGPTPSAYLQTDRILAQVAGERSLLYVSQVGYGATWGPDRYASDGFHPNASGYTVLGEDLTRALSAHAG